MTMMRSFFTGAAGCVLAGAAAWAAHATVTWLEFGRAGFTPSADRLLDRFMPRCEVEENFEIRVDAPAPIAFAAAHELVLERLPLVRALFRARELLLRVRRRDTAPPPEPFLDEAVQLGWQVLDEEPGRAIVMGAVTQPWLADATFHGVAPERFAGFDAPGFAQIAWTIEAVPVDAATSIVRTVTRVRTTDRDSHARFRLYYAAFAPGIRLIRIAALRAIRRAAERRARAAGQTPAASVA